MESDGVVSTRRRLSTASSINNSISKTNLDDNEVAGYSDEAFGLLEVDRDTSQLLCTTGKQYGGRDGSKWLRPLGLTLIIFLLITLVISASKTLFPTSDIATGSNWFHDSHDVDDFDHQDLMLGIQLYPEHHAYRPPKTITQEWIVTSGLRSPDGVQKQIYLVNGQFPGPTIECRSGDRLVIYVTNGLTSKEGISIHWHGLDMRGANHMDGASGLTQCPIPSGRTLRYEFEVSENQSGTFWWHAHSQVQRGDGMYGGLVVHEPTKQNKDMQNYGHKSETLLLIGDWYHRNAEEVLEWYESAASFGNEPVPDSMVINGAGKFICSMALPARPVECKDIPEEERLGLLGANLVRGNVRLRIVNTGSLAGFMIRASGHTLMPLTVDGGFQLEATAVNSVGILYPGERVDLMLALNASTDLQSSRLHISLDPEDFKYANPALQQNQSFPLISIRGTPEAADEENVLNPDSYFDLSTAVASSQFYQSEMMFPTEFQQTILLYTRSEKLAKFSNRPMGFINRTSWISQSTPNLPLISLPRSSWDQNQLIPYVPLPSLSKPLWVDIIINNLDDGTHPFHLHGHSFYVLSSHRSVHGWGSYSPFAEDGSSAVKPLIRERPVRKDTIAVPRRGYVILRFRADNVGIWMFHCHVLFHQATGMAIGLQVGGDEEHRIIDERGKEFCEAT